MRKYLLAAGIFFLVGCSSPATPTAMEVPATVGPPTSTPPPTATPVVTPELATQAGGEYYGRALPLLMGDYFAASGICGACHSEMFDETGENVSIDALWRGSMKANAAVDPYWQASVRHEISVNPALSNAIEDKCATCHMPMARTTDAFNDQPGRIFDDGYLNPENELHVMAMDGVSCTLCHQIEPTGLGGNRSYNGGFVINESGDRVAYGPFRIEEAEAELMLFSSGYLPLRGVHINQSELCATCHTLTTSYTNAAGTVIGEFPEQMPYFEWFYSSYRRTDSCQDCHMPTIPGGVRIGAGAAVLRSPVGAHSFVGANAYMLEMLKRFAAELDLPTSELEFETNIGLTTEMLQERTARLKLEELRITGGRLLSSIKITNLAGHKLPTAYPSRRVWLHVTVQDAAGSLIFESGGYHPDGSIIGNDNDLSAQDYEPHYSLITSAEQVQIYETILRTVEGDLTTTLLRASGYRKDNRIPPAGYQKGAPFPNIAVHGKALDDEDFNGGGDTISYAIDLGSASGELTITVELLYQSISFRWAENLVQGEGPEIERFSRYYQAVPNLPVVIASLTETIVR